MGTYNYNVYSTWTSVSDVPNDTEFVFLDHLNGFSKSFTNPILDLLQKKFSSVNVVWHNVFDSKVLQNYSSLNLKFSVDLQEKQNFSYYDIAKSLKLQPAQYSNFVCSFNGSFHFSRMLLTSALHKFGWFNQHSTKNFVIDNDIIEGYIMETCGESERFLRKFIVSDQEFYDTIYTLGYSEEMRCNHHAILLQFEKILKSSFLHVVSETLSSSYHPFITEKVLYSILTKGLWVAYAAPTYHSHLEKYYGFRKFSIFDYSFDHITNPVMRLIEMLTMLAKFEKLSKHEWHDLYTMEKETIDFNFDHYMSKEFLQVLRKYE